MSLRTSENECGGELIRPLRRPRRRAAVALALSVLVTAACAGDGRSTDRASDPDGAQSEGPPSGSGNETASVIDYEVWFVSDELLHASSRSREATPRVGAAAMDSLLSGPSEEEQSAGLTSAIPTGTKLLGLEVENGVATVDLSPNYETGGGSFSMRMRLAQVVYTLTQFPTVSGVLFEMDGRPVTTFSSEGIVLDDPLKRADFEDLSPPIIVDVPKPGAEVHSPVTISGTANVFEATVSIRIRDATGKEIARDFTTATCGTGCRGSYATKVKFVVDEPQRGTIEVFEQSMEDGSDLFVVRMPVTLQP
jgi:germination protein M